LRRRFLPAAAASEDDDALVAVAAGDAEEDVVASEPEDESSCMAMVGVAGVGWEGGAEQPSWEECDCVVRLELRVWE
jgi:hypothetical protein